MWVWTPWFAAEMRSEKGRKAERLREDGRMPLKIPVPLFREVPVAPLRPEKVELEVAIDVGCSETGRRLAWWPDCKEMGLFDNAVRLEPEWWLRGITVLRNCQYLS